MLKHCTVVYKTVISGRHVQGFIYKCVFKESWTKSSIHLCSTSFEDLFSLTSLHFLEEDCNKRLPFVSVRSSECLMKSVTTRCSIVFLESLRGFYESVINRAERHVSFLIRSNLAPINMDNKLATTYLQVENNVINGFQLNSFFLPYWTLSRNILTYKATNMATSYIL